MAQSKVWHKELITLQFWSVLGFPSKCFAKFFGVLFPRATSHCFPQLTQGETSSLSSGITYEYVWFKNSPSLSLQTIKLKNMNKSHFHIFLHFHKPVLTKCQCNYTKEWYSLLKSLLAFFGRVLCRILHVIFCTPVCIPRWPLTIIKHNLVFSLHSVSLIM